MESLTDADEPFEARDVTKDRPMWVASPGRLERSIPGGYETVYTGARALEEAVRGASPGDVIRVRGTHGPLHMGSSLTELTRGKADVRFWGADDAVIETVTFDGSYFNGNVSFYDINIRNRPNNFASVWLKGYGHVVDLLQFVRCRFQGSSDGGWAGYGNKWQIKGTGYASLGVRVYQSDLRKDGAEEHNIYLLNPMGRNVFDDLLLGNTRRTAIQGASRRYPNGRGGFDSPLYLPWELQESFHIRNCQAQNIRLSGGSAYTLAGFNGHFIVEDSTVQDSSFGYAVTSSSDWHGTPLYGREVGNQYATKKVSIIGPRFNLPNVTRDHIMLSGVDEAMIDLEGARMVGNKTAISLQTAHGGGLGVRSFAIRNGGRRPSNSMAFRTHRIMKVGESVLSDAEVDEFASA